MQEPEKNNNSKNTSALIGLSAISTLALIVTHYLKYSNDLSWTKIFNQSWNPTISDPTFAITNITIGAILLLSVAALIYNHRESINNHLQPIKDYCRKDMKKDIREAAPVFMGVSGSILTGTLCFGHHGMDSWAAILNKSWNPTVSDPSIAIINIAMSVVILLSLAAIVLLADKKASNKKDKDETSSIEANDTQSDRSFLNPKIPKFITT